MQCDIYDEDHKISFNSALVCIDVYEFFIGIDFTYCDFAHDRSIFNQSALYCQEKAYITGDQYVIVSSGLEGNGPFLCPFKQMRGGT